MGLDVSLNHADKVARKVGHRETGHVDRDHGLAQVGVVAAREQGDEEGGGAALPMMKQNSARIRSLVSSLVFIERNVRGRKLNILVT